MEKQTLHLSTIIHAPKEKVWDVLLQDETYRQWTSVFHPGSYAEGDWKEGSKILFKTPEGNGMVSKVVQHKPYEVIALEHQGVLKNGKEDYEDEEVKKWQGFKEIYRLNTHDDKTKLSVEQDATGEYAGWLTDTWEQALQKVKELAENNA